MSRPAISGIGLTYLEYLGVAQTLCQHGRPAQLDQLVVEPAGTVPLALATAASLGARTSLASALPLDYAGRFLRESLSSAGIDTSQLYPASGVLSPIRFAVRQGKLQQVYRSFGSMHGDGIHFNLRKLLAGASALLVSDDSGEFDVQSACELAAETHVPIVCDISQDAGLLQRLAPHINVLIVGERLACELSNTSKLEASLRWFADKGPDATVITLGDAGCTGIMRGTTVQQPAYVVDEVDVSGAGAVFAGALTTAMVSGLAFSDCLRFANAAAAISCTRLGAWAAIPTRSEVERLLETTTIPATVKTA